MEARERDADRTRAVWLVLAAGVAAFALLTAFPGQPAALVEAPLTFLVLAGALASVGLRPLLRPVRRGAWCALGLGLALLTGSEAFAAITSPDGGTVELPTVADVGHLGAYVLGAVGLLLLARPHLRSVPAGFWLDGLIAALAAAALGAALLVQLVIERSQGDLAELLTRLAYPVADVFLLALVVGTFSVTRWRPGRSWLLIGAALAAAAVADGRYVVQAVADADRGTVADPLWLLALVLIAVAAWAEDAARERADRRPLLVVPVLGGALALGLLAVASVSSVNPSAIVLACAALAAVIVRLGLVFAENARLLVLTRGEADTDALTGLGSRRKLISDLSDAAARATPAQPCALVMFDLDGFKLYNDSFGHPAGDLLLSRLGARLMHVVGGQGRSYRLGGDEFCILVQAGASELAELLDRAATALNERGVGFAIAASFGSVLLPDEAGDPTGALQLADERLYRHKRRRQTERERPHEPLLQALYERAPLLQRHVDLVAALSVEVARALGLDEEEQADVGVAARLHDIGKLAIPDTILHKEGPLTDEEWTFIRQHTIIGQRIVASSPPLHRIAAVIRASHERFDGNGYPDGLHGSEIPLAARIISACDALDAMTEGRAYATARPLAEAVAELDRCAGAQFDPEVVRALRRLVVSGTADGLVAAEPASRAKLASVAH